MANEILLNAIDMPSDLSLAKLYLDITKTKIFCYDTEKYKCFIFDLKLKVYKDQKIGAVIKPIQEEIENFILNKYRENRDQRLMKGFLRILTMISSMSRITKIIECIFSLCQNEKITGLMNINRDTINFRNGILNLQTGKFRERTMKDYVSKYLDYDYSEEQNVDNINYIAKLFRQICNDDEELYEFNLAWFGYCMTGYTDIQKMVCTTGYTASNGKSRLLKIFESAMSIYCKKADNALFCTNFSKRFKHLTDMKAPIRLVFVEEAADKPLDTPFIKDFVDGSKISGNEVMYGTIEDINLQCKIYMNSNKTPKFPPCRGIKRRILLQYFTNQFFVEKRDYDKNKHLKGMYLSDLDLDKKFERSDDLKVAVIHLLLPYAMQYYELKEKLIIPEILHTNFDAVYEDNDRMKMFIENFYDITGSDDDKVYKEDFNERYRSYIKNPIHSLNTTLDDVKRLIGTLNIKYDSQRRVNGSGKGCIIGLKLKREEAMDLFEPIKITTIKKKQRNPLDDIPEQKEAIEIIDTDSESDSDSEIDTENLDDDIRDQISADTKAVFMKKN